jgi:hypothetical protein
MQAIRETIYSFKARWFDTHAQCVNPVDSSAATLSF